MPIKDLMTEWVETVGPEDSIRQAAMLMVEDDIGMVPVCNGDTVVGVRVGRESQEGQDCGRDHFHAVGSSVVN